MSNLINKVKEAVSSDKHHDNTHTTSSTGTTGTTGGSGLTGTTGTAGGVGATGAGFDNDRGLGGPATRTDGPHSSNIANKADPRVDSDRDYSRNMGANPSGTATTGGAYGSTGSSGLHSTTGTSGAAYGTTGSSGLHSTTGTTGTSGLHSGAPVGGAGGAGFDNNRGLGGPATRTDGPHSSNLANQADPRVDSDRDYSRNMGANPSGTASTGGAYGTTGSSGLHSGTTGTHGGTGLSGTTGGAYGSSASGPGPAPNTAGPHKSDMLNKADPRVDSNLDGSKTVGGDKTFAQP